MEVKGICLKFPPGNSNPIPPGRLSLGIIMPLGKTDVSGITPGLVIEEGLVEPGGAAAAAAAAAMLYMGPTEPEGKVHIC
jgi:hypothetical protein